jgi:hypothetical protein
MAISKYFYIPGNPEFMQYQGKCWRRMTQQSLAGETLIPGTDVEVFGSVNECLGLTDTHEIAELEALVKVSPGGVSIVDPTSEVDMDIFHIRDLSFLAQAGPSGLVISIDTIQAGIPVFKLADVSADVNLDHYPLSHSYNVYTDNGLDPVTDPPNYIPGSTNWATTIEPDVLLFHSGLPA